MFCRLPTMRYVVTLCIRSCVYLVLIYAYVQLKFDIKAINLFYEFMFGY